MLLVQFEGFAFHNEGIDKSEIAEEQASGPEGVGGDTSSKGKKAAAEVKRVAGASVGPGNGENLLLVKVPGSISADDETEQAEGGTDENGMRSRMGKPENDNG